MAGGVAERRYASDCEAQLNPFSHIQARQDSQRRKTGLPERAVYILSSIVASNKYVLLRFLDAEPALVILCPVCSSGMHACLFSCMLFYCMLSYSQVFSGFLTCLTTSMWQQRLCARNSSFCSILLIENTMRLSCSSTHQTCQPEEVTNLSLQFDHA